MSNTYTIEEIKQMFRSDVCKSVQDASRVPNRDITKVGVLESATSIYNSNYNHLLHKSILDEYN